MSAIIDKLKKVMDESSPGKTISSFDPFVVAEGSLSSDIASEFRRGEKVAFTKREHEAFPALVQMTFRKDGRCYTLYVGFMYATAVVFNNFSEYYSKVMQKYGKWRLFGGSYLDASESVKKVPLFTQIAKNQQAIRTPYFTKEKLQVLFAMQVSYDDIEDDNSFFKLISEVLGLCTKMIDEIDGAHLEKYDLQSLKSDLKTILKIYLHSN